MSNYLVIGGSSGIGYEVVKKLASNNNKIYIMSRNPNKIEDLENITKISYDVTSTEKEFPSIEEPFKG
ncbi:MAG: SDR family NAD(P)-dependent oxidoreductase, partial [Ignavibacteria bacterium]|nr:SDR family NAD(P)-dependent oxidoreductase [Ignavibacteria bacterium]